MFLMFKKMDVMISTEMFLKKICAYFMKIDAIILRKLVWVSTHLILLIHWNITAFVIFKYEQYQNRHPLVH